MSLYRTPTKPRSGSSKPPTIQAPPAFRPVTPGAFEPNANRSIDDEPADMEGSSKDPQGSRGSRRAADVFFDPPEPGEATTTEERPTYVDSSEPLKSRDEEDRTPDPRPPTPGGRIKTPPTPDTPNPYSAPSKYTPPTLPRKQRREAEIRLEAIPTSIKEEDEQEAYVEHLIARELQELKDGLEKVLKPEAVKQGFVRAFSNAPPVIQATIVQSTPQVFQ
ncbi:hypothetical protein FRC01_012414, partial [Tulasnella sp. 417]